MSKLTRHSPSRFALPAAARRAAPVVRVEPVERRVLLSAGQLDPTFGSGGRLTVAAADSTSYKSRPGSSDVQVQTNGDLIVVQQEEPVVLTRLTATGAVDTTYGTNGHVTLASDTRSADVFALPGGGTLVAYSSADVSGLTLEELTPTGAIATDFGSAAGTVSVADGGPVAVGPDGSIYVVESSGVVKYSANGSLDTAYGTGGTAAITTSETPESSAIAVDADGRVVLSLGETDLPGVSVGFGYVVERLTPAGAVDDSFGDEGVSAAADSDTLDPDETAIALAPDGTIYAGDDGDAGDGDDRLAGIRAYSSSGALEETLPEPIGDGAESGAYGGVLDLTVQPDGQLVATGYSFSTNTTASRTSLFVARYTPVTGTDTGGALDTSFNGSGVAELNYASMTGDQDSVQPGYGDYGDAVAIAANGDVVVAGASYEPPTVDAAAVSEYTLTAFQGETAAVLTGTVTGTAGSYDNQGNTVANAFDGNLNTYFDGPTANGDTAGLDVGAPEVITQINYAPRSTYPARMVGGVFQGSNTSDFSSGVDTLYTITAAPAVGSLTTVAVSDPTPFEYVRYVGPNGSYGNVAEVQFLGYAPQPTVLVNGVLDVSGTAGADNITVTGDDADDGIGVVHVVDVTVNGSTSVFPDDEVGPVVVNAGSGDDSVSVQEAYMQPTLPGVVVNGGAGDDTLSTGQGVSATLNGDLGNDTFDYDASYNESPPITVSGGGGDDTLSVTPSDSTYINLDGKPDSNLDGYPDSAGSQIGTDIQNVYVNAFDGGSTTIFGDALGDTFGVTNNRYGPVSLVGGAGNDTFIATSGQYSAYPSTYSGGAGVNTIDFSAETDPLTVYLDGSKPSGTADQIAAGDGDTFDGTVEEVYGGSGNDLIYAAPGGGDALYGNGGNDTLVAQGGADALFGGDGNDTLDAADGGSTYIDGGDGTDTAYVDATGDTTVNVETVVTPTPTPTPTVVQLTGTTYGTVGSYNSQGNTIAQATDGNLNTFFDAPTASGNVGIDLGSAETVTEIGYAPRSGYASRMVGGAFQVSTSMTFSSNVTTVYTIATAPTASRLTTVAVSLPAAYEYWRYLGPANGYCNIAEFQLFGPATTTPTPTPTPTLVQLTGTTYGTPGSYLNDGNTIADATDGKLNTFFDAPSNSGGNVGINLGSAKTVTEIAYAPRAAYPGRMVGGEFQYSTSPTFASGITTVYTITAAPAVGVLTTVAISAPPEQYWRYLGPAGGFCNIAEFQLFGPAASTPTPTPTATKLTGTTYGTIGSYDNQGNTIAMATDGNLSTFFDAPTASGGNVGIDLGSAQTVTEIGYAPRSGYASRMVGGEFQVSTSMTFSSNVTTVYTITTAPAQGQLTMVPVSLPTAYQYWRYLGPANGECNIAEFQLFGG